MRTHIVFLVLLLIGSIPSSGQKNVNFIISIDEQVVVGSVSRIKIVSLSESGAKEIMDADYYPGNLSLKQSDYDKLIGKDIKSIVLAFDYSEYCNNTQLTYNYEIQMYKGWLDHYFNVLNIFNTSKKKYRNIYTPLDSRNYTYEFYYPGGSVKRVRKKSDKESCN